MTNRSALKPSLSPLKTVRGRIAGYRARWFGLEADAPSKPEAIEACVEALHNATARLRCGAKIGRYLGHTYVITPTDSGWRMWVDLFERLDYGVDSGGSRTIAEYDALQIIAQHVWQPQWSPDNEAVVFKQLPTPVDAIEQMHDRELRSNLRSWFDWQRKYAQARAAGHDDNTARNWAGGMLRALPALPAVAS